MIKIRKLVKYLVIIALLIDLMLIADYVLAGAFRDAWAQCSIALWWIIILTVGWLDED